MQPWEKSHHEMIDTDNVALIAFVGTVNLKAVEKGPNVIPLLPQFLV